MTSTSFKYNPIKKINGNDNLILFTITKLKKEKLTLVNCMNLLDEGDSTVIIYSMEYAASEVRILNFYKLR